MPRLSYREMLERYDRAKAFGEKKSLAEYSEHLNKLYKTQDFSEGLRDGPWTRFSTRADQFLEGTVGQATGPIGAAVGEVFGHEEAGRMVGEKLPRGLIETAPLYLLGPEAGIPATAAALGLTGAAMGAHTYADTGSPTAAVISGAVGAAMPPIAGAVGNVAARAAGAPMLRGTLNQAGATAFRRDVGDPFKRVFPETPMQKTALFGGSQAAQGVLNVASMAGVDRATGGETPLLDLALSPEFLIQQIPFTVFDAVRMSKAPKAKAAEFEAKFLQKPGEVPQPTKAPEYVPPPADEEGNARREKLIQQYQAAADLPAEQQEAAFAALRDGVLQEPKVPEVTAPKTPLHPVFGARGEFLDPKQPELSAMERENQEIFGAPEPKATELRPAIRVLGDTLVGEQGQTHQDILNKYIAENPDLEGEALVDFDTKENPNFFVRGTEEFSREQVKEKFGVSDSQGLRELQKEATVITEPEAVKLVEMGTPSEVVAKITPDLVPPLKEAVARNGDAKVREVAARERGSAKPATPEEHVAAIGTPDLVFLKTEDEAGATPDQLAESAKLAAATVEVDAAVTEQAATQAEVEVVLEKHKVKQFGQQFGPGLKGPTGARAGFESESQALEWLSEYHKLPGQKDTQKYEIRKAGKEHSYRYYLAPEENVEVSIDKPMTQGGETLQNVIADTTPQMQESVAEATELGYSISLDERPEASVEATLRLLESASAAPRIFAAEADMDLPDAMLALRQAKVVLRAALNPTKQPTLAVINAALKDAGVAPFATEAAMSETMAKVQNGADAFRKQFSNKTLGSVIPHDETLVEEIGVRRGAEAVVDWITNQDFGITSLLTRAFKRFPDELRRLNLILPGDGRHVGWTSFYERAFEDLNVQWLPQRGNERDWAEMMSHEIVHHMERELSSRQDPAAVEYRTEKTRILEEFRKNADLPRSVRALLERSLKEGHYGKFTAGKFDIQAEWRKALSEKDFRDYHDILYAMQNEDELSAQMFSSPKVQAMLSATNVKRGGIVRRAIDWFSTAWNKLMGGGMQTDNALAQLISGFDNYLTGGLLRNAYNGVDYIRDALFKYGVRPEGLASRMQSVERAFARGDLRGSITAFVREGEGGLLPVTSKFGQLDQPLRTALVSGDPKGVYDGTMSLLAEQLPQHQELWNRMRQDVQIATELHKQMRAGKIPGSVPKHIEGVLKQSHVKLNAMRRALDKQALALERWNALDNATPEGYDALLAGQMHGDVLPSFPRDDMTKGEADGRLGFKPLKGEGFSLLRWLQLTTFVKETVPAFKDLYNTTRAAWADGNLRGNQMKLAGLYDPQTGDLSNEIRKSNIRVTQSTTLSRAVSDLMRWQNDNNTQVDDPDFNDPQVKEILGRSGDPKAVIQMLRSSVQQKKFELKQFHDETHQQNVLRTASIMTGREKGLLPQDAFEKSARLFEAVTALSDPQTSALAVESLRQLSTEISPETFQDILQLAHQQTASLSKAMVKLNAQPWQATEQRLNTWHLEMTGPNGERFRAGKDTVKELETIRAEMEAKGFRDPKLSKPSDRTAAHELRPEVLQLVNELDAATLAATKSALKQFPDLYAQLVPALEQVASMERDFAAQRLLPGVTRKAVAGREYIDMLQNQERFHARLNLMTRNRTVRLLGALHMQHPEIAGNRELLKYSQSFVENLLTPDNPYIRKMSEGVYFWRLGADIGQMMIEGTQTLTTGMHELVKETGYVGDAAELIKNAAMSLWNSKVRKGKLTDWQERMLERAGHEGLTSIVVGAEMYDPEHDAVMTANYRKAGPVKDAFLSTVGGLRRATTITQRINEKIMLFAGLELAQKQGITDFDKAYAFARDIRDRSNFTAGKVQRNVGPWLIKTKPVPQLISLLQTYTVGWFSQIGDSYVKGWGKMSKELSPTQRLGAKKAFAYSLIAQAAVAGALGLPGFGQGLALFSQITGIDAKGWLRQQLGTLFEEDEAYGGFLTNLALRGVASAGLPFDPSGRMSIGVPYIGVDSYSGFKKENLLGPAGGTLGDIVEGFIAAAKGDKQDAVKMLPNAFKRPAQLLASEGDIRDKRGGLMMTLSPAERALMAIGLPSSRVQAARDTGEALRKSGEAAQRQRESLADELARRVRAGDTAGVKVRLAEIQRDQPDADLASLIQSVGRRVEAQSYAYEARRSLPKDVNLQGLNMGLPSTELARRQTRYSVESSLGLRPAVNPGADYQAALVDQLLNSDPYLSRVEAKRRVREMVGGRRQGVANWQAFQ